MGLAMPIEQFSGMFKLGDLKKKEIRESNQSLELFANFLVHHEQLSEQYDTNQFLEDIETAKTPRQRNQIIVRFFS